MKAQFNLATKAVAISALLATGACDVLTQNPPTALSTSDAFANADRISKSATGMYDALQNAEFYGGRALIYGDTRSDDEDYAPYFSGVSDYNQTFSNTAYVLSAWTGGYQTIFSANLFMQNLAANPGKIDQATTDQYMGEAKFIRAITMFQLCNLFAQPYNFTSDASHLGIPVQLTAPDGATAFSTEQRLARSSVKDVYAQIEKDLLDAASLLPASSSTPAFSTVARATKGAAEAMLMRLYLYKGDYASSLVRANNVIATGAFALNPSPVTAFRTFTTRESIFSVAMNSQDNPNTNNALSQHYNFRGRADITVTPYATLTDLSADDIRRTSLLEVAKAGTTTPIYTAKYQSTSDWVPVLRYPEVLLTQAEDLVLTTNTVNSAAIIALNAVHTRAKGATSAYTASSFATAADLLAAIRTERRLELAFEGLRLYDLFRYKQGVPARGTVAALPYGSPKEVLPIPFIEVTQNPNLQQNPGY
jgi:hypothetical protein